MSTAMTPIDLILVRHGESEGNLANRLSRKGDHRLFTEEFRARHSGRFRLTPAGRQQAVVAGQWLKSEFGTASFDQYLVSDYLRAMETAALLDLPEALWDRDFNLRERDWGRQLDVMPEDERQRKIGDILAQRKIDAFYWRPPDGESMANVCLRTSIVWSRCQAERVLIVCHNGVMWSFRVNIEHLEPEQYHRLSQSADPHDRLHNGHILHYTRRNPASGKLAEAMSWMRSICPWDQTRSSNVWREIVRPQFTNQQLLEIVEQTPSIIPPTQ